MDDDGRIPERHAAEVAACFKQHSARLFGYARVLTHGDHEQAMDLVQETFEAAALTWGTLRELSPDGRQAWLYRTLRNKVITDFRRRRLLREKLRLLIPLHQPDTGGPDEELETAAEQIAEVIKDLPGQQYKVALLRWGYDMKARQIADLLGMAEGTVHSHLNAARTKLASALGSSYKRDRASKGEAS